MVFFICSNCGGCFKKKNVPNHAYQCKGAVFSCMDCNKDFSGDSYKDHFKCMTEVERYSAVGWTPPANHNKGEKKQMAWIEIVQRALSKNASSLNPSSRNLLHAVGRHDNVPRKKAKFINFIKNIGRGNFNELTINEVWNLLETEWKQDKELQTKPPPHAKEDTNNVDIKEEVSEIKKMKNNIKNENIEVPEAKKKKKKVDNIGNQIIEELQVEQNEKLKEKKKKIKNNVEEARESEDNEVIKMKKKSKKRGIDENTSKDDTIKTSKKQKKTVIEDENIVCEDDETKKSKKRKKIDIENNEEIDDTSKLEKKKSKKKHLE